MKYLIIMLLLSFNTTAQVLSIEIQQPLVSVEIKHQEESQYSQMHEDNMYFDSKSFDIYFEESQIYDVIVNTDYFFTFKARFYDDVLMSLDDIEILCHCSYEVVDNRLIVTF